MKKDDFKKVISFNKNKNKKNKNNLNDINKKNLYITIILISLAIIFIILFSLYIGNESFRTFLDIHLFNKNINSSNSTVINFEESESNDIFSYDKYIAVLNKNTFSAYSSSGNKDFELSVNLISPISSSNNRFLCLAEKDGKKLYLINGQNISWQKDLEDNISRVNVNKNGYVSVITTGASYKSIVITFDPNGKELFKSFLSNTVAVDVNISNDNKYLALAEIDYSGASIQSNIKILSMEKSQKDPTNAIDYIYPANSGSIVTSIKYGSRNRLVCMYNDSIHIIQNNSDTCLSTLSEKDDIFADINLSDHYIKVSETNEGLFSNPNAHVTDISGDKDSIYKIEGTPKSIYCNDNVTAINLGSEIHFINNSAWVIKKFSTSQEAKNVIMGSGIAGIIYKNKIEIISL